MVDFVPYETFERDRIKDFYHELLSRYVSEADLNIEHLPEDVIKETLNSSLERMKKKIIKIKQWQINKDKKF